MKKYLCIVFILFVTFYSLLNIRTVNAFLPLSGKVIVVDPGHGGKDPGTNYGDLLEKDINLSISKKLENELIKNGAIVILTREGDYDLSKANATYRKKSDFDNRISIINTYADLYLSIHLNYLNETEYKGAQVFYNKDNKILANVIQNELNDRLKGDREIKKIPTSTYMYNKLQPSGVLIECGFLSNNAERNLLKTEKHQEKIASTIAKAIVLYYQNL